MKTIEIFGKKVPVIAMIMALMVIGTASAAVFLNYATLSGTVEVSNGISVTDSNGDEFEANGEGFLNFNGPASFTINNANNEPVIVNLVTTLTLDDIAVDDFTGLTVDYSVIDSTGVEGTGTGTLLLVPPGGLTIEVVFYADDNAMPGEYNITMAVDYNDEDYNTFYGENAMETLELSYKNDVWQAIENGKVQVDYAPMGNAFYYEMEFDGVDLTDYALIYYADKPDRFNMWGGDNPGAIIQILPTSIVDGDMITNLIDLDMDLPHLNDANFDTTYTNYSLEPDFYDNSCGAKLWLVPLIDINPLYASEGGQLVTGWFSDTIVFETELIQYTDTNL